MFRRSWVRIPAPYTGWTFFTYNCCKNCNVCLKRPKINEREAGVGPFLKRLYLCRMVAMTRHKSNEMFIPSSEMFVLIGV